MANYAVCMVMSLLLMKDMTQMGELISSSGWIASGLGVLSGVLYLANFLFYKYNMKHNGIVMSATFMKLGVLVLLLISGFTDSMANVFEKLGSPNMKDAYLFVTFGIPNYFSSRFLLLALEEIDAVLVYPTYSVATMIVIMLAGMCVFHEKISRKKLLAVGMIILALGMLNS